MTCYRYIELNPVAAGMTRSPEGYPWSSYAYHGWGRPDRLIREHPLYIALGANTTARQRAYRALFRERPSRMSMCIEFARASIIIIPWAMTDFGNRLKRP